MNKTRKWRTEDYFITDYGEDCETYGGFVMYETYTCILCGYTFETKVCGTFNINDPSPIEKTEEKMSNHLLTHHKDELGKKRGIDEQ